MDNSIITLHRRTQLCLITSGGISTLSPVTEIAFGVGGVDLNGDPIPPAFNADSLTNEIARYPVETITYPINPPTTARYSVTIPAPDLPGASISEAALVDGDGLLCAIKTFFVKRKDAGVTFTFTFDDEF